MGGMAYNTTGQSVIGCHINRHPHPFNSNSGMSAVQDSSYQSTSSPTSADTTRDVQIPEGGAVFYFGERCYTFAASAVDVHIQRVAVAVKGADVIHIASESDTVFYREVSIHDGVHFLALAVVHHIAELQPVGITS